MALVKYTAIVDHLSGRVNDRVFSVRSGVYYSKANNPNPANPNTARQQLIRSNISSLSAAWRSLPTVNQSLWSEHAKMTAAHMMGYTSFMRLNMALRCADHPDLGCVYTPPKFPATPQYPMGFCVFIMSDVLTCITWNHPLLTSNYITGYFRLHRAFCDDFPCYGDCLTVGYRPSKRFIATVRSDVGQILFTHSWPAGTQFFHTLRSLDTWGRQSPFTHEIRVGMSL